MVIGLRVKIKKLAQKERVLLSFIIFSDISLRTDPVPKANAKYFL